MIISRTPLRVSFVGGGTDLPAFYEEHGGAVLSTTIDKWIHVVVSPRFEGDIRVSYSRTEIVDTASEVEHELVREALRLVGLPRGVDIATLADVPSRGTGLGSSSAVTVGLLNALYAFQGVYKPPACLAEEACQIEIELLGKPIGRQDQYAAATGGMNLIEFLPRGQGVRVSPLIVPPLTLPAIHRRLLLFYTGRDRSADTVLTQQRARIREGLVTAGLLEMRDLAYELRERLCRGEVDAVGPLLHRNWELKRTMAGNVTDVGIDDVYAAALEAGATGGKILGAGSGGFLLVFAPPDAQPSVRAALVALREVPFRFTSRGTEIVFVDRQA